MSLVSLYTSFGDQMLTNPEYRAASAPALTEFQTRRNAFDLATAKVHLISDQSTFKGATRVERFVLERLSTVPPYHGDGNPFAGVHTLREEASASLADFLRAASRHAGIRARGAKAAGLGVIATKRDHADSSEHS
jgi:hypothetical protein